MKACIFQGRQLVATQQENKERAKIGGLESRDIDIRLRLRGFSFWGGRGLKKVSLKTYINLLESGPIELQCCDRFFFCAVPQSGGHCYHDGRDCYFFLFCAYALVVQVPLNRSISYSASAPPPFFHASILSSVVISVSNTRSLHSNWRFK